MDSLEDSALLRRYSEESSEEAFAALVKRHINFIYSMALRRLGNPHQAEEVTQAVFIILARKAVRLGEVKALSGWLFQTTLLTANNFERSEIRRRHREQEAYVQSSLNDERDEVWRRIAPSLDEAVAALREKDRRAIVLRFYEGCNLREIGLALGASEDAAEKRVTRAVENLQKFFERQGIHSTTTMITEAICAHSVQAAPVALVKSVTSAALAKGGTAASVAAGTMIAMKVKSAIFTLVVASLCIGTGTYIYIQRHPHHPTAPGIPPLAVTGVGLYVGRNQKTHKFEVRRVFPNSPAEKAGVLPGLVLSKVNDIEAATKSIKDLSKLLMGPPGSTVNVELMDTNGNVTRLQLMREAFLNRSKVN